MRLKNYLITEGRSVLIDKKQAVTFIQTKAKYILPKLNDICNLKTDWIYRGAQSLDQKPCYMITPSQSDRTSANTLNYYTWIIDNSPLWVQFPKRSQSIICTSSEQYAFSSKGDHYLVIPAKGSKIGICPEFDIWGSFNNLKQYDAGYDGMSAFNDMLSDILGNKSSNTYHDFITAGKVLDTDKNDASDVTDFIEHENVPQGQYEDFLSDYYFSNQLFYEFLQGLMGPVENKFKLSKVEQYNPPDNQEVWTDGDSLLVNVLKVSEILGELI